MMRSGTDDKGYLVRIQDLMYRVYGWMFTGLSVTAATAYFVATSPKLIAALYAGWLPLLLIMIVQFALVFALSAFLSRLSFPVAAALFLLFSVSVGATMASIFLVFTASSIFVSFLVAASMFGAMSLYGYLTSADLSKMGSILLMGLVGIIIASLINLFVKSSRVDMIISFVGVIIFTLLTAYDTQRIKQIAQQLSADHEMMGKISLFGALALYLDFINLFLFLLRFSGTRRSE